MSKFQIKARQISIDTPAAVAKNLNNIIFGQYRDLVDSNTSPQSGLDHPTLSIHDVLTAHGFKFRIDGIRIQRIKDMTEEEARLSGVEVVGSTDGLFEPLNPLYKDYINKGWGCWSAQDSYSTLFDLTHGEGTYSSNPWVWVFDISAIK